MDRRCQMNKDRWKAFWYEEIYPERRNVSIHSREGEHLLREKTSRLI